MATFTELQDKVKRRVIDLPSAITTEVPDLVNWAVNKAMRVHNFFVMKASVTETTAADTRVLVAVPSDFKEMMFNEKPYYVDYTNGAVWPLEISKSRLDTNRYYTQNDTGSPDIILISELDEDGAGNFEVWPLSDGNSDYADGEYRITIPYFKYLPELSASASSNWITANGDEWVVTEATAHAFEMNWDEQRAQYWRNLGAPLWKELTLLDKRLWISGVDTFVPYRGVRAAKVRR